ncbi:glycerol-3-phosphate O-acyltransferase [Zymobacter palmae]|uniref:Glycerol-3-phosphate O-acyltransferase n=2 Tax=Zymobacter palmae TaxID=33074 RepID=A0A348HDJ6_9GAMM|nr:glycerol-3-phosphate O-acyltransferase [Zymobacter palmae]
MNVTMTTTSTPDRFDSLRPYRDDEVVAVLDRLAHDREFLNLVGRYRLPRLMKHLPCFARFLTRQGLQKRMKGTLTIADFQQHIADYMNDMIAKTVTRFETEGAAHLDPDNAYLFIGNHRDISLDPAFLNLALHHSGRDTVRIAIGDNLLKRPFASDLMRLNKSFIVPRSSSGKREMLQAFRLLSDYIAHSLRDEKHSIWIAQRQGRAKDGIDRTEPGIIKMICMSQGKQPLGGTIKALNIVPVSISYEYDPCALMKARELQALETDGSYEKQSMEDMQSIAAGITGQKGRVSLHFGTPLSVRPDGYPFETAEEVAAEIDRQVLEGYTLFPPHMLALKMLGGHDELVDETAITEDDRQRFNAALAEVPEDLRPWWLQQYANPVLNRAGLIEE